MALLSSRGRGIIILAQAGAVGSGGGALPLSPPPPLLLLLLLPLLPPPLLLLLTGAAGREGNGAFSPLLVCRLIQIA